MMTLAKALYDNTAECPDELAFRKGDILTVMEQNVAGTSGWWMCSLYGRQGLAPANRLRVLSQTLGGPTAAPSPKEDKAPSPEQPPNSQHNIYQIPSVSRANSGEWERKESLYEVPSTALSLTRAPRPPGARQVTEEQASTKLFNVASGPRWELYDVPSPGRRGSLFVVSTTPRATHRKHSLVPISELQKRLDSPLRFQCEKLKNSCIYDVPPNSAPDSNYDIPVPSTTETQNTTVNGYRTLPILRTPEWIYDVPVAPDKQSSGQNSPETTPPRLVCQQELYDTIPARSCLVQRAPKSPLMNNIPKSTSLDSPPTLPPRVPLPQRQESSEQESVYVLPSDDHIPLECRIEPPEATKGSLYRRKNCPSFRKSSGQALMSLEENDQNKSLEMTSTQNQRISTASSSSSSSCDSFALSSSSPEPLREVLLQRDEVSRRLLDLQNGVCRAVPRIMEFVSSDWRSKSHMEKHLEEIKDAAREVADSVNSFLVFVVDIKGNARQLSDCNLQARLYKQLCAVEDSGVILQLTVSALNAAGWTLDQLTHDAQTQTPDHLERFVMVARTIPEDVKRLVSMINANGKLLFKPPQKEQELILSDASNPQKPSESREDVVEDDYVELQTKTDFENQQKEVTKDSKDDATVSHNVSTDKKPTLSESPGGTEEQRPGSLSEHCRLYFGALQKAIGGFVDSLSDGQPPEKFISQGKLVIMVGQRLVDTLYKEAHHGESRQSLLCKSSHLCALLKQLAVATKKAALHFPDRQAVHEALEFAKELAQRAQHFRQSLGL